MLDVQKRSGRGQARSAGRVVAGLRMRKAAGEPSAARPRDKREVGRPPRIALAMAGGGPLGAMYEIGALAALAEAMDGIDFNRFDIYVGVSAGGILGAALANGITPRQICRMFIDPPASTTADRIFDPSLLMRPAFTEYRARLGKLPPLLAGAAWRYAQAKFGTGSGGVIRVVEQLLQALPAGIFSNEPLREFLAGEFGQPGRTDDFRELKSRLFLIATDLDSGKAVAFGSAGHDAVPISLAAAASSALPGLFPPVEIGGRCYVDGALKRTLHASVALKAGADLVLCLNPLVPYDDQAVIRSGGRPLRLVDGGLPYVVLQTIRAVIHSRMEIGMRQYADDYPAADVILFEPDRADAEMFFSNMFSYSNRKRLCEHAYQRTRAQLWQRRHELQVILARHGIALNIAALRDRSRTLVIGAKDRKRNAWLPMTGIADRLAENIEDIERYLAHLRAVSPTAAA